MTDWIRRLRGATGMGVTWAVGWAPLGAAFFALLGLTYGAPISTPGVLWAGAKQFAAMGFFSGGLFAVILGAADRHRRFDQLSTLRLSAMGALGGALLGAGVLGVWGFVGAFEAAVTIGITGTLGAASAATTLFVARRAEDQALLEASHDVASVGLTPGPSAKLPDGD